MTKYLSTKKMSGMTLVETLMALGLTSLLMVGVVTSISQMQSIGDENAAKSDANSQVGAASDWLANDFRIGKDFAVADCVSGLCSKVSLVIQGANDVDRSVSYETVCQSVTSVGALSKLDFSIIGTKILTNSYGNGIGESAAVTSWCGPRIPCSDGLRPILRRKEAGKPDFVFGTSTSQISKSAVAMGVCFHNFLATDDVAQADFKVGYLKSNGTLALVESTYSIPIKSLAGKNVQILPLK